jgi:hypothetical protein
VGGAGGQDYKLDPVHAHCSKHFCSLCIQKNFFRKVVVVVVVCTFFEVELLEDIKVTVFCREKLHLLFFSGGEDTAGWPTQS